jgi:hypothetical protein
VKDLSTRGSRVREERSEKATLADPGIATDEGGPTRSADRFGE